MGAKAFSCSENYNSNKSSHFFSCFCNFVVAVVVTAVVLYAVVVVDAIAVVGVSVIVTVVVVGVHKLVVGGGRVVVVVSVIIVVGGGDVVFVVVVVGLSNTNICSLEARRCFEGEAAAKVSSTETIVSILTHFTLYSFIY